MSEGRGDRVRLFVVVYVDERARHAAGEERSVRDVPPDRVRPHAGSAARRRGLSDDVQRLPCDDGLDPREGRSRRRDRDRVSDQHGLARERGDRLRGLSQAFARHEHRRRELRLHRLSHRSAHDAADRRRAFGGFRLHAVGFVGSELLPHLSPIRVIKPPHVWSRLGSRNFARARRAQSLRFER